MTPVLLVGVDFGLPHFDAELEELGLLAQTAGMQPVARITCKRKAPDAALFIGSGKADEIRTLAHMHGAVEVLFDQSLSPAQQRNLERHIELPVNDRTLLILEIFAQRARSHEGKLQVELAKLQYVSTRLVRRWSHLERQTGGIGARGGPGEKQIELDRRMIGDAIKRTRERLVKVKRQRSTQRRQRERRDTFNISLVGYTNAGKSTLFNALVKARAWRKFLNRYWRSSSMWPSRTSMFQSGISRISVASSSSLTWGASARQASHWAWARLVISGSLDSRGQSIEGEGVVDQFPLPLAGEGAARVGRRCCQVRPSPPAPLP